MTANQVHATKHQGPDAVAFTALNRGGLLTPPLDPERDLLAEPVEHDIEVQISALEKSKLEASAKV